MKRLRSNNKGIYQTGLFSPPNSKDGRLSEEKIESFHQLVLTLCLMLAMTCGYAQQKQETFALRGKVYDFKTRTELPGATVQLMRTDSTVITTMTAIEHWQDGDRKGETSDFTLIVPKQEATYIVRCNFLGYKTTDMTVTLSNLKKREFIRELPPILMREDSKVLKEVTVSATKVQFYYRGDTVVYNADAFVLAEGSMLDALVRQLPGVEIRGNGDIYHNGRLVKNLMLNGKDFFRSNKKVMLDNLPTYMVKQIEVYDKVGRRSEFLGEELPGDKEYVMDVKLKKEYSVGWIANAEVGAGLAESSYTGDNPYLARLFTMRFTDHSRLAFYANVNDLNDERKPGEEDGWTPEQMKTGVLTRQLAGLDYNVDSRNQKWKVRGEANFSHSILRGEQTTDRTNFLTSGDTYERIQSNSRDKNLTLSTNHTLDYTFKMFTLNIRPSLSYHHFDQNNSMDSETWGDTLLNRYFTHGLMRGHDWQASIAASSMIKFKGNTVDHLEVGANASYGNRKDDTFNRYNLFLGSTQMTTQHADQYFRNHPDYHYSAEGYATYGRRLNKLFYFSLRYDVKHAEAKRDSRLFRLDQLADYEQGNLGILPSVAYDVATDWNNSYESRHGETTHTATPYLSFHKNNDKGYWYGSLNLPLTLKHERFDYLRGAIDTTITRNTFLMGLYNTFMTWTSKDQRTRIGLWYTINSRTPDLLNMVNMRDDTDPLNIREGNTGLRNSYQHQWRFTYLTNHKVYQRLGLEYSFTDDAFAIGYRYDTATGVRTRKAYNVDGNWNVGATYDIGLPIDRQKRLRLTSITGVNHRQSADLVGVNTSDVIQSTVKTEGIDQTLKLDYRIGKHVISTKFDGGWRYVNSNREDFANLNIWNYDYGLTAAFQLPLHLQFSTDLTMFSRRGYHDVSLNTDDFVWNARLSYTTMKGNLIFMLDGFDILGQLSNVTYTLNGQGHTETRRNVLPQYALFHVQYRLNKQPKK